MAQKKIQDIYPLSPMQQGMLFHSLLEPNSGAYIIQTVYELHGQVDLAAFGKSWQQLVDRHSILRTAFVWDNLAEPLQVVGTAAKISLIEHDWQEIPLLEQQERLTAFLQKLKTTGFNLNQAPLMRLDSIKMRSQVYQFIWTYHHLLLDGWSVPLLIKELLEYYQSFTQDLPLSLTTAFPYKNYIAWLKQQDREQALSYWQQELQGFNSPTPLEIATDIVRRENSDCRYLHIDVQLSAETTYKLEFLAREYQLTLNTLIQAAWGILLHRYSGDSDLVFGATTSGRPPTLAHSQAIIGLFINTLPVRVKIDSQQSLIGWLKQLQAKQIARQEHEYISLIDIHRVSDLPKDTPLFNSIVVFENYPVSSLKQSLDVLDLRNVQTSEQTNYPLTLYAAVNSQLSLKLLYNEQLFSDRAIAKLLEQLKTLLQTIASNPKQKVGELDILTKLDKKFLTPNSTATSYPRSCWHQLFEAKVAQIQEKNAVIADDDTLTYSELNEQANQLAHYLQLKNVTTGSLVGIYLERDSKLLISLLAVLKAGAAYVPLDPNYPRERVSYIIARAGISHLVIKQNIESNTFNSDRNLSVINLETEREIIQQQSRENLDLSITPQNLAYVIYTSGSTGKPKGVAVQHDSLVNFLYSMKEQPGITKSDRLLAITTISFDIAALELYLPLLAGATVIIAPSDIINSNQTLAERIEQHQITIMQATPITWRMLLADNWLGNKELKILSGGEALKPQLAQQLLTKGKEVWNLYGPTETTIWSSVYQLPKDRDLDQVFLGKAIANTQFYVLDSQLRLVPPGAIGELHIAGAGLARGYLNQPDLTAEKFIPNPFSVNSQQLTINSHQSALPVTQYPLLYQTGDRVRQLPSGDLEYLGRLDNQIKIRGFRIELGEIEAVLNQHPNVQTSVAITNDERLIAYVTLDSAFSKPPELNEELNQFLSEKLPQYMMPSNYVLLEKLPLTPNGKVDRHALVKLDLTKPSLAKAAQKPQSATERAIAEVWQDVLQVERVGLTDNFFDLGGQSLLMIRVHSQIKEKLDVDISLVDMFRYPTVASLAKYFTISTTGDRSIPKIETALDKERIDAGKNRLQERRKKRKV
ncbi:MAG: amino acid adenylation domain-containing protein [Cyanobacteria bacterium P01_G01_bin.39]